MNYLAHLHLADVAALPLSGAVLGDFVRGRLDDRFPLMLEKSIRLHRRIDVVTDAHPLVAAARVRFDDGARRYAGILLDLIYDHCLALDWPQSQKESLNRFTKRAAAAVSDNDAWRLAIAEPAPSAWRFRQLLLSYRFESGIERAISRVASRMKQPQHLIDAGRDWRAHVPQLRLELPLLMADLERVAHEFVAS